MSNPMNWVGKLPLPFSTLGLMHACTCRCLCPHTPRATSTETIRSPCLFLALEFPCSSPAFMFFPSSFFPILLPSCLPFLSPILSLPSLLSSFFFFLHSSIYLTVTQQAWAQAYVLGYMEHKAVPASMDFTFEWRRQTKNDNKQTHTLQSRTLWWAMRRKERTLGKNFPSSAISISYSLFPP
jgi:hypothetical protein